MKEQGQGARPRNQGLVLLLPCFPPRKLLLMPESPLSPPPHPQQDYNVLVEGQSTACVYGGNPESSLPSSMSSGNLTKTWEDETTSQVWWSHTPQDFKNKNSVSQLYLLRRHLYTRAYYLPSLEWLVCCLQGCPRH